MCTINRKKIVLSSARADGNGAYQKRGNVQKHVYYIKQVSQRARYSKSKDRWYINKRTTTSSTFRKEYVAKKDVYLVKRQYRYNKLNDFLQLIVEVKRMTEDVFLDYYYVLHRWLGDKQQQFSVGEHGNAPKPFQVRGTKLFLVLQSKHITEKKKYIRFSLKTKFKMSVTTAQSFPCKLFVCNVV